MSMECFSKHASLHGTVLLCLSGDRAVFWPSQWLPFSFPPGTVPPPNLPPHAQPEGNNTQQLVSV